MAPTSRPTESSLDVLEREDIILMDLFGEINRHKGSSVEERYKYGGLAKSITRHISLRQSSLMDVASSTLEMPLLHSTAERLMDRAVIRRDQIDKIGNMSRSIQGIYLNTGQDFDGELAPLMAAIGHELEWELAEAIPLIRRSVETTGGASPFRSASYVTSHARLVLSPSGRRWFEYMPIVSRLLTIYDRLRDHPRAAAHD